MAADESGTSQIDIPEELSISPYFTCNEKCVQGFGEGRSNLKRVKLEL